MCLLLDKNQFPPLSISKWSLWCHKRPAGSSSSHFMGHMTCVASAQQQKKRPHFLVLGSNKTCRGRERDFCCCGLCRLLPRSTGQTTMQCVCWNEEEEDPSLVLFWPHSTLEIIRTKFIECSIPTQQMVWKSMRESHYLDIIVFLVVKKSDKIEYWTFAPVWHAWKLIVLWPLPSRLVLVVVNTVIVVVQLVLRGKRNGLWMLPPPATTTRKSCSLRILLCCAWHPHPQYKVKCPNNLRIQREMKAASSLKPSKALPSHRKLTSI